MASRQDWADWQVGSAVTLVRRRIVLGIVIAFAFAGFAMLALLSVAMPRTPSPPAGAIPLAIRTQPSKLWPPPGLGCPAALVVPLRVARDGASLVFMNEASDSPRPVVWPSGFTAWELAGRALLIAPDGAVFASEGDVISGLGGSAADNGDILICLSFGSRPVIMPGE